MQRRLLSLVLAAVLGASSIVADEVGDSRRLQQEALAAYKDKNRVIRIRLTPGGLAVSAVETLLANADQMGDPTLGTVVASASISTRMRSGTSLETMEESQIL